MIDAGGEGGRARRPRSPSAASRCAGSRTGRLGVIPALDQIDAAAHALGRGAARGRLREAARAARGQVAARRGAGSTARSFRGEIQALAAIRTYLCTKVGGFAARPQVLAARRGAPAGARALPPRAVRRAGRHRRGRRRCRPAEIVVANHYTDLRDLDPDPASWRAAAEHDDPAAASRRAAPVARRPTAAA